MKRAEAVCFQRLVRTRTTVLGHNMEEGKKSSGASNSDVNETLVTLLQFGPILK